MRSPERRSSGVAASGEKIPLSPECAAAPPPNLTVVIPRTENRTPSCQTPSVCAATLVEPHRSFFIDRRSVESARKPVGFLRPAEQRNAIGAASTRGLPETNETCPTGPPSGIWHGLQSDACRAVKGTSAARGRRNRWFRLEGGRYRSRAGKSRSECEAISRRKVGRTCCAGRRPGRSWRGRPTRIRRRSWRPPRRGQAPWCG